MTRGRKRKHDPSIPAHIDQQRLPAGLYWDRSGAGRWYVRVPHPEGIGSKTTTVAGAGARLSDLHAIMEQRAGNAVRGTIGCVIDEFEDSTEFKALATGTQKSYKTSAAHVRAWKTPLGPTLDQLQVDKLEPPVFQRLVEIIAKGQPESRPGAGDGRPAEPSKANHLLRFLRRTFAWGVRYGHCKTNPAKGVKQAKERKQHKMPAHEAYLAVLQFARLRGARKAHSLGSSPPYLAPLMEIAYLCRLRGIEINMLVEAQGVETGLRTDRRKGSQNNIVAWTPRLRTAWDALLANRAAVIKRRHQPEQIHAERRYLVISEDGEPLTKSGLDSAWQRLIASCVKQKIIAEEQRFSLHDLKRKGGTDTSGTKADKQQALGVTEAMMKVYDHSLAVVKPSDMP